jgi:hypothetical protein
MDANLPADLTKSSIPIADVRAALEDILHSEAFSNSRRCCDFLSYVVEQVLAGVPHELKERTIAVAVFGRTPSYDSHEDAIVRINASEVRKRLGYYYAGPGKQAAIQISLPRGGYVPIFTHVFTHAAQPAAQAVNFVPGNSLSGAVHHGKAEETGIDAGPTKVQSAVVVGRQRRTRMWVSLCSVLVLSTITIWVWSRVHHKPSFLEEFWAPALHTAAPVYLVAAAAPVFVAYAPGDNLPTQTSTEYVATSDQFVGQGDMLASHRIAAMLENMHQPYEVKASNSVDVRDLPRRAVVLIGYSSTQWESISKGLRYYIDGERAGMITDRGKDTEWYPRHLTKDLHADEDYAIVSRFVDPGTRALVVLVSGATQYGTEGAAMLVTDGDMLHNALRDRPPGWGSKNVQIVLHMKVIANSPATPEVVATYYW